MLGRAAVPRVLGELIEGRVKRNGDEIFFRFSNRCAHAFQNLGVWKGDKVSIMLPNRPEHSYVAELLPRIFFLAVNRTEHPI